MSFSPLSSLCRFWSLSRESGQTKPATIRHPGKVLHCGRLSPSYLDLPQREGLEIIEVTPDPQTTGHTCTLIPRNSLNFPVLYCTESDKSWVGARTRVHSVFLRIGKIVWGVFVKYSEQVGYSLIPSPPSEGMGTRLDWIQRILFAKHTPLLHTLGTNAP